MEGNPEDVKDEPTTGLAVSIRNIPRQLQCRWASSACDTFHLGQIVRFFTVRTKTVFLGSSLIDPDFSLDPASDSDRDHGYFNELVGASGKEKESNIADRPPMSDICSLVGSLRQCPDYQLDSSHNGCGVRRRLLPALDCIEGFVGDGRSLLGVILRLWNGHKQASTSIPKAGVVSSSPLSTSPSWISTLPPFRNVHSVDIRLSKISAVHFIPSTTSAHQPSMNSTFTSSRSPRSAEEDARLFFTARRRNWEA